MSISMSIETSPGCFCVAPASDFMAIGSGSRTRLLDSGVHRVPLPTRGTVRACISRHHFPYEPVSCPGLPESPLCGRFLVTGKCMAAGQ